MKLIPQKEIFKAMEDPGLYPHPVDTIEVRETHISRIFLTGNYVYKIKKPVDFGFLDFTTLEKRRHYCEREIILNRRLASDVYLEVVSVHLQNGCFNLAGDGEIVEYAVKMKQLSEKRHMTSLLRSRKIGKKSLEGLALKLTRFYNEADAGNRIDAYGSWDTIQGNCEENFLQTEPYAGEMIGEHHFHFIRTATHSFLQKNKEIFENRRKTGKIRDCHGDLRSEHIYFYDDIKIIDCIEFNDRFRYGDIASDLAFLCMDLDHLGFPQAAHDLLSLYSLYSKDLRIFILIDFYKCYRAFVRAKVNCLRAQEIGPHKDEMESLLRETQHYVNLAYRYAVRFTRPTLWVICGLPATGKSTIGKELGRILGIKIFRSDVTRKKLFGLTPEEQRKVTFEQDIYSPQATSLTYGKLLLSAQDTIKKGDSVILDATYHHRKYRDECRRMAKDEGAAIVFAECRCFEPTIKKRLAEREKSASASDARWDIYRKIKKEFEHLEEGKGAVIARVSTEKPLRESIRTILSRAAGASK